MNYLTMLIHMFIRRHFKRIPMTKHTQADMRWLVSKHWTYERIGKLYGVSRQRVCQIVKDTRD